jgi:hypothetical protein
MYSTQGYSFLFFSGSLVFASWMQDSRGGGTPLRGTSATGSAYTFFSQGNSATKYSSPLNITVKPILLSIS